MVLLLFSQEEGERDCEPGQRVGWMERWKMVMVVEGEEGGEKNGGARKQSCESGDLF